MVVKLGHLVKGADFRLDSGDCGTVLERSGSTVKVIVDGPRLGIEKRLPFDLWVEPLGSLSPNVL
jgi:hypothetical protein